MVLTRTEYTRGIGTFDKAVAINVGPEKQCFHLHAKLLAEDSEFFKAATDPRWDVPGREALDLSDEDPSVFEVFAIWLYESRIVVGFGALTGREMVDHIDSMLIKAYGFAQRRLSSRFHDAVISAFARRLVMPDLEALSAINMSLLFDESSKGSALRRLMIDYTIWLSSTDKEVPLEDCRHPDFLLGLSKAQALTIRQQARQRHAPSNPTGDICKYHQHGDSDEEKTCDLYKPEFNDGNERDDLPSFDIMFELTAGLEAKTFHISEDFLEEIVRLDRLSSGPHYCELDSAAIELCLKRAYFAWDLTEVVHTVHGYKSREKDEALLMQLTHLYYIGVHLEDHDLLNSTLDAIVEWTFVCQRSPSGQCLSFASDYALKTKTSGEADKLLYLLVMLFAHFGTHTFCENVRVLQILAIAQSSLRDTRAHLSTRTRKMPRELLKKDLCVCKHFHRHLDGEPVCYRDGHRSSKDGENLCWGDHYHNMFHSRLKKLPRSVLHEESYDEASATAQNDGDHEDDKNDMDDSDKHRRKRPRST